MVTQHALKSCSHRTPTCGPPLILRYHCLSGSQNVVPEPLVIKALELARNPDVFTESETLGVSPPPHPLCLPEPSRWLWNMSEFENQWPADEPPPQASQGSRWPTWSRFHHFTTSRNAPVTGTEKVVPLNDFCSGIIQIHTSGPRNVTFPAAPAVNTRLALCLSLLG